MHTVVRQGQCRPSVHKADKQPKGDASHKPSSRLSLHSARPTVTFPDAERHRPWPVPIYTAW